MFTAVCFWLWLRRTELLCDSKGKLIIYNICYFDGLNEIYRIDFRFLHHYVMNYMDKHDSIYDRPLTRYRRYVKIFLDSATFNVKPCRGEGKSGFYDQFLLLFEVLFCTLKIKVLYGKLRYE